MKTRALLPIVFLFAVIDPARSQPAPAAVAASRTIQTAIAPPPGYRRIALPANSFGAWLRNCPLKPAGAPVRLYDGRIKPDRGIYTAVLDVDIGTADLQQCADAVMRLRAEYLFHHGRYDAIGFHFTNGFHAAYRRWREGGRIAVAGSNARWVRRAQPDGSHAQFRRYLETVFAYAGTLSLERELRPVRYADMQPGDVLIRGGSPGHAVTVMDMAVNAAGQKAFLLSQSYMPAQDIQILRDPAKGLDGVWYLLQPDAAGVITPEWNFTTTQLRRFP